MRAQLGCLPLGAVSIVNDGAESVVDIKPIIDAHVLFKDTSALLEVLEGRLLQLQLLPAGGTQQHRLESVCVT